MEIQSAATIECPYCSGDIAAKAKKCRHCGEMLDPQMRELELLKSQKSTAPTVFMNAGGGGGAAIGSGFQLHGFRHWLHIILTLITGGMWLPVYVLLYLFRRQSRLKP